MRERIDADAERLDALHALEHAGIDPATLRGSRSGVFVGCSDQGYTSGLTEVPDDVRPEEVVASYRAAIADSDVAVRERGLDAMAARWDFEVPKSVRWVVAHMTGETARHAGHADILRELIDGVTGR